MRTHDALALGVPRLLVPRPGVDLSRWSVIACDQYTSEPAYWASARTTVGDAPSTLDLIYPEVFLGELDGDARIRGIQARMDQYLADGVLVEREGCVYVERTLGATGHVRRGLVVCLDLERYDFRKGSSSLVRATEGTILDRIPPRVRVREGAALELPHIMVLVDDPADSLFGPLRRHAFDTPLYDFDLMLGAGHLRGFLVDDAALEAGVLSALAGLAEPAAHAARYGVADSTAVLLYAVGDGNHSLATAKTIWERAKETAGGGEGIPPSLAESPLRYALVELVNLHDEALVFEPIHRVLFSASKHFTSYVRSKLTDRATLSALSGRLGDAVEAAPKGVQRFVVLEDGVTTLVEVRDAASNLAVGTLQALVDAFLAEGGAKSVDYVHGEESLRTLAGEPGAVGIYLPKMDKNDLFKTVILDGALPRKTFSMGEADEKRFYLEARRLR